MLGGARSGKSRFAEVLAVEWGAPVLYVATARALDDEMVVRISRHRAERPAEWRTLEEPLQVAEAVGAAVTASDPTPGTVLVEDLGVWLSNALLAANGDAAAQDDADEAERLVAAGIDGLCRLDANLVLVSNEVGLGLVPPYPLGRFFRDALGRVNQHAAAAVSEAYLLVAGLPVTLKRPD